MQDDESRVYIDYVNQALYYSNTTTNIYFLNYNGVLLKNISFAEGKVSALTLFEDYVYLQKMDTRVIQEMDVFAGVVNRNIPLPKPLTRLNDLAIVEQSQYPTCKMKHNYCIPFIIIAF
jgi:hypothetical protein